MTNLAQDLQRTWAPRGIMNVNNTCVRVLLFYLMKGETQ